MGEAGEEVTESQPKARGPRLQYVTPAELDAARQDPAWEARHGISNRVVCRVCGGIASAMSSKARGHLWLRHKMTRREYHLTYPGAVLRTIKSLARLVHCDVKEMMARIVARYVTPEELRACRQDPEWEKRHNVADVVICRECGLKVRGFLSGGEHHLNQHDMTLANYHAKHPGAPWRSLEYAELQRQASSRFRSKPGEKEKYTEYIRRWRRDHPEANRKIWRRRHARIRAKLARVDQAEAAVKAAQAELEAAKRRLEEAKREKPGPQSDDALNADLLRLHEAKRGTREEIDRGDWAEIKSELDAKTGVHLSIGAYKMRLKRYRSRVTN
jgi:hypothetical protein